MRVSEAIGRVLVDGGVEAFFGLAGSGNFAVLNALHEAGATFYSSRHETGAVMMADGYARASGKVGVASVHQGPGFTNSLTGLTEAAKARTPLVVLAADIPAGTLWSNFKVDQAPSQRRSARSPSACAARDRSSRCRPRAQARPDRTPPRRPEHPDRPGRRSLPRRPDGTFLTGRRSEPPVPSEGSVAAVVDLLASSRRPAIVAGRGAALSGARGRSKPWETGSGPCSRRARWGTGSSPATLTPSVLPAVSPPRSP